MFILWINNSRLWPSWPTEGPSYDRGGTPKPNPPAASGAVEVGAGGPCLPSGEGKRKRWSSAMR